MKKLISVFALILVFSLIFVTPCLATELDTVTFSEDFKSLTLNGVGYSCIDTELLDTEIYYENGLYTYTYTTHSDKTPPPITTHSNISVSLSDAQSKVVKRVEVEMSDTQTILFAYIYYKDGSTLTVSYIRNDLKEEYNKLIKGDCEKFTVDFVWPEGNTISYDRNGFLNGRETTLSNVYDYMVHDVNVYTQDKTICINVGLILADSGKYYFLNFIDSGISSNDYLWEYDSSESFYVTEITDPALIEQLKIGEQKYFEDDLGYIYNDELSESISKVFFVAAFAVAPLAILIVSLVLSFKAKKKLYKKLLLAISGLCAAEVATVIYIAYTLFTARI